MAENSVAQQGISHVAENISFPREPKRIHSWQWLCSAYHGSMCPWVKANIPCQQLSLLQLLWLPQIIWGQLVDHSMVNTHPIWCRYGQSALDMMTVWSTRTRYDDSLVKVDPIYNWQLIQSDDRWPVDQLKQVTICWEPLSPHCCDVVSLHCIVVLLCHCEHSRTSCLRFSYFTVAMQGKAPISMGMQCNAHVSPAASFDTSVCHAELAVYCKGREEEGLDHGSINCTTFCC